MHQLRIAYEAAMPNNNILWKHGRWCSSSSLTTTNCSKKISRHLLTEIHLLHKTDCQYHSHLFEEKTVSWKVLENSLDQLNFIDTSTLLSVLGKCLKPTNMSFTKVTNKPKKVTRLDGNFFHNVSSSVHFYHWFDIQKLPWKTWNNINGKPSVDEIRSEDPGWWLSRNNGWSLVFLFAATLVSFNEV